MKKHLIFNLIFAWILLLHNNIALATCVGLNCTCTVGATTLNFGTYDPFSSSSTPGQGTVSVTCSALILGGLISYTIQLSQGNSGNYAQRTMNNGSTLLNYNLYTDAAYTQIWGDGSGGTSLVSLSYTLAIFSRTDNFTAYGSIPSNQNVNAGLYTDTIMVTVTF